MRGLRQFGDERGLGQVVPVARGHFLFHHGELEPCGVEDVAVVREPQRLARIGRRRVAALAYLLVWTWQEHKKASKLLGQQVLIDNRPGAGGSVGTELVARAPADGHTVTFINQGTMTINPHLYANPGFTVDQFVPVSHLASVDLVICANPSVLSVDCLSYLSFSFLTRGFYLFFCSD